MRSTYLISSLGLSPGVVTGTIDALQYGDLGENYSPTHVAIITTDNELTRLSLEVVEQGNENICISDKRRREIKRKRSGGRDSREHCGREEDHIGNF